MDEGRRKAIARRKAESTRLERLILSLIQQGHSQSEIARQLDLKRQSVYRIVKRLRAEGRVE